MENAVVFVILGLIILLAVGTILHRRKLNASCCGSGTYVAKSRKLANVAEKLELQVEGMLCQNCVNRVMEAVQDMGHTSAVVNLKKGLVTVTMDEHIDKADIAARIEKAGYTVN